MKIKETVITIPGAPLDGVSPLPAFRRRTPSVGKCDNTVPEHLRESLNQITRTLPYTMQDRYSRARLPLKLKCYVLENDYLRAEFLPEYGGRLYALYDKINERDLVLRNPVIQPGNLAIRNAWLSGGIEWNLGNIGHTVTTCDNVFSAILKTEEGEEFLRIWEYERQKGIAWQVDFHLPDGSRELITHVRQVNAHPKATTTYWWSNVAAPHDGRTRVIASGEYALTFVDGGIKYEELPYISAFPGKDLSYPANATRSMDYFIQENRPDECTWEACAYSDGLTLYERSTPPLNCKKLFCWGNHRGGDRWQEFLSDGKGTGYYVEIQAGIAPSQLHERKLAPYEMLEWTQVFGGIMGEVDKLHQESYPAARDYLRERIDERMSEGGLHALDERMKKAADIPVTPDQILHTGSGFGALEAKRMAKAGERPFPSTTSFPSFTIGKEQYPWSYLLDNGILPEVDRKESAISFSTSEPWRVLIEESLDREGGRTWYSLMHYGIAVYEGSATGEYSKDYITDEYNERAAREAEAAWLESVSLRPTPEGYRALAKLENDRGNLDKAESYYDLALGCEGSFDDFAIAAEYLGFLLSRQSYEKVWELYTSLPDNCKAADRIKIYTASAAAALGKLDYLESFFAEEHFDIREGECSLTDVWFEFCARRIARERGITELTDEVLAELIDEAWDTCPPDYSIDFRMSLDKKNKYRI